MWCGVGVKLGFGQAACAPFGIDLMHPPARPAVEVHNFGGPGVLLRSEALPQKVADVTTIRAPEQACLRGCSAIILVLPHAVRHSGIPAAGQG